MTPQQKYREANRDEINARQLAAYHERKGVTGTMHVVELPDVVDFSALNLRERYLLALLERDAVIWKKRYYLEFLLRNNDGEILSSHESFVEPYGEPQPRRRAPRTGKKYQAEAPCGKCGTSYRYVSTKQCVECMQHRNRVANAAKRKAAKAAAANVVELRPRTSLIRVQGPGGRFC